MMPLYDLLTDLNTVMLLIILLSALRYILVKQIYAFETTLSRFVRGSLDVP